MARQPTAALACGLVQVIRLTWTKSARGGQGARDRNSVPAVLEVPTDVFAGAAARLCVDISHWGDGNDFAEPFKTSRQPIHLADGFQFGCVSVCLHTGGLQVCYQYDQSKGGAPDRWFLNCLSGLGESSGRILKVHDGEWVRVCYNGRFTDMDTGNWWYEQITVNVAWFAGELDGQVFLARKPSQKFESLADLW